MPPENRKLRPNQPLVTRALLDAREAGLVTADLFGIAPPDQPDHPWSGFSAFKRSFGGHDIAHLGTWERDVVPGGRHLPKVLTAASTAGEFVRESLGRRAVNS